MLDTVIPTVVGLNVTMSVMLSLSFLDCIELKNECREMLTAGLDYRDRGEEGPVVYDAVFIVDLVKSVLTADRIKINTHIYEPSRGRFSSNQESSNLSSA